MEKLTKTFKFAIIEVLLIFIAWAYKFTFIINKVKKLSKLTKYYILWKRKSGENVDNYKNKRGGRKVL